MIVSGSIRNGNITCDDDEDHDDDFDIWCDVSRLDPCEFSLSNEAMGTVVVYTHNAITS